jgi:hypothetical protein
MRRLLVVLAFLGSATTTLAGGSGSPGKITAFSGSNGSYEFTFVPSGLFDYGNKCAELRVRVEYSRVPWYSWLPFVRSTHPTRAQTEQAAALLEKAYREKGEVLFGYMGYGLADSGQPCHFLSKGLIFYEHGGYIMSFYGPV